jgi:hypothetical protein
MICRKNKMTIEIEELPKIEPDGTDLGRPALSYTLTVGESGSEDE